MFSIVAVVLFVLAVYLLVKVVKGVNERLPDETTGDSGVFGTDLYKNTKASVDSEFKVEEPTPIDPAIVDVVEEAPKPKKKKPAAKKKTASRKKKAE